MAVAKKIKSKLKKPIKKLFVQEKVRHLFRSNKVAQKQAEGWKVVDNNIGIDQELVLMEK